MVEFKVNGIYGDRSGNVIKITSRSNKGYVSFVHLTAEGREYDLGFKRKKIDVYLGAEHIWLPIGITGVSFSAEEEIIDWEKRVEARLADLKDRRRAHERALEEELKATREWLKRKGLTISLCEEVMDVMIALSSQTINTLREEENK